jgi:hypothetical protein
MGWHRPQMQGKEADVVVLVLGTHPHRTGARGWAAERPNLLNVAVSRARRRIYVIGNRAAWGDLNHFKVLAASRDPWPPRETDWAQPARYAGATIPPGARL